MLVGLDDGLSTGFTAIREEKSVFTACNISETICTILQCVFYIRNYCIRSRSHVLKLSLWFNELEGGEGCLPYGYIYSAGGSVV
jgi:hypothetical protein